MGVQKHNRKRKTFLEKYVLAGFTILLIVTFVIFFKKFILHRNQNYIRNRIITSPSFTPTPTKKIDGNSTHLFITPTILRSGQNGWNEFTHPLDHFSFSFPAEWHLELLQHRQSADWYQIILSDYPDTPSFHIHFSTDGRDYPNYEQRTATKILGGKTTTWKTLYRESKAVELLVGFPHGKFNDHLIGLYVYLPDENQEEFISRLEQIVASLE